MRKKSAVWLYFKEIRKGESKCKICKESIKHYGNTTNLKNHLQRKHSDTDLEKANVSELNDEVLSLSSNDTDSSECYEVIGESESESKKKKKCDKYNSTMKRSMVWRYFTRLNNVESRCNVCLEVVKSDGLISLPTDLKKHLKTIHKHVGKRSGVWRYFKELEDGISTCRLCNENVKSSGNTTNLKNHIKRYHENVKINSTNKIRGSYKKKYSYNNFKSNLQVNSNKKNEQSSETSDLIELIDANGDNSNSETSCDSSCSSCSSSSTSSSSEDSDDLPDEQNDLENNDVKTGMRPVPGTSNLFFAPFQQIELEEPKILGVVPDLSTFNLKESNSYRIIQPTDSNEIRAYYRCDYCIKNFRSEQSLKAHNKRIHPLADLFKNDFDGKNKNRIERKKIDKKTKYAKNKIKNLETGRIEYKCDTCGKLCSCSSNLVKHLRVHTGEKPYKCKMKNCDRRFSDKWGLKIHTRAHTGEKPVQCDICHRYFSTISDVKRHIRTHTGEKPYKCNHCDKSFSTGSYLKTHIRLHFGDKPFSCDVCNKMFSDASGLKKHIRVHTGDKPYECEQCHKGFTTSSSLRTHTRIHTGERPYKCKICDNKFKQGGDLQKHIRTHTGVAPFKCDTCEKTFKQRSTLITHIRSIHPNVELSLRKPGAINKLLLPHVKKLNESNDSNEINNESLNRFNLESGS